MIKQLIHRNSPLHTRRLVLFAALFSACGITLVIFALAAGPFAAFEPENGTLSGGASAQTVTGASGGKTVKFSMDGAASGDITLAIAGDVQKPRADLRYGIDTLNLMLNQIHPNIALIPGDVQYESGALSDFNNYFAKTWGKPGLGFSLYPSPGNHDYGTSGASGYYSYFNAANGTINGNAVTGPADQGYYAFNAGPNWRIYSLNSETAGSTAAAQNAFLSADLAANPKPCTLMFDHKPYYDYGTAHAGDGNATLPWLKTLYSAGGDVVIGGHEHNYQRFKPVNPNTDAVDTVRGLQTFVVGTGGADNLYPAFGSTQHSANSLVNVYSGTNIWGVLKIVLHSSSYDWQFVPVSTNGFTDSGSGQCH